MKFVHHDLGHQGPGRVVTVRLEGTEANVRLLDDVGLSAYKAGRAHRYVGGHYKTSPVRLRIPSSGHWHVVVDLGGFGGTISSSASVSGGHFIHTT